MLVKVILLLVLVILVILILSFYVKVNRKDCTTTNCTHTRASNCHDAKKEYWILYSDVTNEPRVIDKQNLPLLSIKERGPLTQTCLNAVGITCDDIQERGILKTRLVANTKLKTCKSLTDGRNQQYWIPIRHYKANLGAQQRSGYNDNQNRTRKE